jgi:hypothetical protein
VTSFTPADAVVWSLAWLEDSSPGGTSLDGRFSARKSETKLNRHSTGTEYVRRSAEYLVAREIMMLFPLGEYSCALMSMTSIEGVWVCIEALHKIGEFDKL